MRESGSEPRREAQSEEGEHPRFAGIGPGAVGAWTEEELARLPRIEATPEGATRDEDNPELMRRGEAIGGRRKSVGARRPGEAKSYDEEGPLRGETRGRPGESPGARAPRQGEEEREH